MAVLLNSDRNKNMARTDKSTGEEMGEPPFVKLYIRELCDIKGLSTPQYKMFTFMLANMNYENVVSYGVNTKRMFLARHDIANSTFDNNVSKLIKSGLIERLGKGEFRINKKYATKVPWHKIESIEWHSEYTKDGKQERVIFK